MEIKHFVSGSPIRLEGCVKGRGEVAWSHGQVRIIRHIISSKMSPRALNSPTWESFVQHRLHALWLECCAEYVSSERSVTHDPAQTEVNGFPISQLFHNCTFAVLHLPRTLNPKKEDSTLKHFDGSKRIETSERAGGGLKV